MENHEGSKLELKQEYISYLSNREKLYLQAQKCELEDNKQEAIQIYCSIVDMNDRHAFNYISSIFALHLCSVKTLGVKCQLDPNDLLEFCKTKSVQFPEEAFKSIFILLDLNVITENVEKYQFFLRSNNHPVAQLYWNKLKQKYEKSHKNNSN